jgi:hypothetical protein
MSGRDWRRTPAAYRYVTRLDAAGLAWEFLRRNAAFRSDFEWVTRRAREPISRQPSTPRANAGQTGRVATPPADPLARWGLHFRPEP